jgi:hypothetical protein
MSVFQYVTWVDPVNNVKRLTVIVTFRPTAIEGAAQMVRVSTLFTPGTITVSGTTPGASQGSGAPTPSPSPTPAPTSPCTADVAAPTGTFTITSGTGSDVGYTASANVALSMSFSDSCTPITVHLSNDGATYGTAITYDALNPTVSWTLTAGDGSKSVYAQVFDGLSNVRTIGPNTIVLDTTRPTVPGTLSRTVSCSGSDRTVTLSWGSSTDTNFKGYRVYRSIDSAAWTAIGTSSTTTSPDSNKKALDSVRYFVVGYDKAGNESNATNTIAIAKNQCS